MSVLQTLHLERLQELMGDEISICLTEVQNHKRSADAFVVEFVTFCLHSIRPLEDLQTDLANKLHNLAAVWKSQQTGSDPGCLSAPPNIPGVKLKVKVLLTVMILEMFSRSQRICLPITLQNASIPHSPVVRTATLFVDRPRECYVTGGIHAPLLQTRPPEQQQQQAQEYRLCRSV